MSELATDKIKSGAPTKAYRNGWDGIDWGKKSAEQSMREDLDKENGKIAAPIFRKSIAEKLNAS